MIRLLTGVLSTPFNSTIEICAGAQLHQDKAKEEQEQVMRRKERSRKGGVDRTERMDGAKVIWGWRASKFLDEGFS